MLTQGWRRYDIPGVLKGKIEEPESLPEQSRMISGRAESRLFKTMRGGQVSLLATFDNRTSMEITNLDRKGSRG